MKFPRFLRFYHSFSFSGHALQRAGEMAGEDIDPMELRCHLDAATQLKYEQVLDRGFRPAYQRRRRRGENSWYFAGEFLRREVLFVLTEDRWEPSALVCVTIYVKNRQSEHLEREAMMRALESLQPSHLAA